MSKIRKRFERLLNNPKEDRWERIMTILEFYGCTCIEPDGDSHWAVYHPNSEENLTIPVHNSKVKTVYVKKIIRLLEEITAEED